MHKDFFRSNIILSPCLFLSWIQIRDRMTSMPAAQSSQYKRVILRANSELLDSYLEIINSWFRFCGYFDDNKDYQYRHEHFVHIGGDNQNRFHLIVDMNKNQVQKPDLQHLHYEMYRVKADINGEL